MYERTCLMTHLFFLSPRRPAARPPLGAPERRTARNVVAVIVSFLTISVILGSCSAGDQGSSLPVFRLVTGTENEPLVPAIQEFAEANGFQIEFSHQGSVDTMLELQAGAKDYDAVWPASSIWLSLGDTQGIVSRTESIMASPVVFALKKPLAEQLGWIGRDVFVEEILTAAEAGQISYMTTSATQSNSGAMAYLGYLYAFAGQPQVLTSEMLHDPAVIEPTTRLLQRVDRTAGASGYLGELFVKQYDNFDGMVNNESAVITANKKLVAQGKDPLYVIYPVDGSAIADWPLGFIDREDEAKSAFFDKLQEYVLSPDFQAQLLAAGRRTGLDLRPAGADPAVFNPDWGIDLNRVIQPITVPPPEVVLEALVLYQTEFRKPSFTVYCLDFSGSMEGDGEEELTDAMEILLDPDLAARYMLQPSPRDVTVVLPFDDDIDERWRADGNDPAVLRDLFERVKSEDASGSTAHLQLRHRGARRPGQRRPVGVRPGDHPDDGWRLDLRLPRRRPGSLGRGGARHRSGLWNSLRRCVGRRDRRDCGSLVWTCLRRQVELDRGDARGEGEQLTWARV